MTPQNFSDKTVRIDGYVDSDGFEWILLKDDRCAKNGVNLIFSDTDAISANAQKINNAVFHELPFGTGYKDIRATFIGSFQWRPADNDRHYGMRLVVDRIDNLRIGRLKRKRPSPFPELN